MSFQEKNVAVTMTNFSLILVYYTYQVGQMLLNGTFTADNVFQLFAVVVVLAVVGTILATILTHILTLILEAIRTRQEPEVEDVEDERDELIDLRGTKVTYSVHGLGSLAAMLTFVAGQPALVMFSLLIFSGLVAQVAGDASRLRLYRRGF